jgi:iron complex transport system substrate-binding protein
MTNNFWRKKVKKLIVFIPVSVLLILWASCGRSAAGTGNVNTTILTAAAAGNAGETVYPLVINNYAPSEQYGAQWSYKSQTFTEAPSRAVTTTQTVAELMIRLGLADRIAGVCGVFDAISEDVAEEFAKLNIITPSYASKELVVGARPDIVIGRGGLFANADWGCGTVEDLNDLGIKTFVINASRPGATIEDLYRDMRELGEIFNVQGRAAELVAQSRARYDKIRETVTDKPVKKFAWLWTVTDGAATFYAANNEVFINGTMEEMNLVNVFSDVSGTISFEQVIAANPDILLSTDASLTGEALEAFYATEALRNVNAVKNRQVYIVAYNDFWGYGDQIFGGLEKLTDAVFGE